MRLYGTEGAKHSQHKGLLAYLNARKSERNIALRPPKSPARFSSEHVQANAVIHALEAQMKREKP